MTCESCSERVSDALKTKSKSIIHAARHSWGAATCAVVFTLFAFTAQAQKMFVSSAISGKVYAYTTNGVQSVFADGMSGPSGLAFDNAGNLFVADETGNAIYEFTLGGERTTFASGLYYPDGLAFNSQGNLFEADYGSGNIYEYTPTGTRSTFSTGGALGLAFNSAGLLFDATIDGDIIEVKPGNKRTTFASGLGGLYGLAFNSAGNLFTLDFGSGNVYEITPGGAVSTFASGFSNARGIAFDSAGNLYVANYGSSNIVEIAPNGVTNLFASGIDNPTGIAFGPAPPSLTIAVAASSTLLVSWPAASAGYLLEQNTALGTPYWAFSTNTVSVVNSNNQVTINPGTNNMFFQLVNP
jgi:sugar lactone lactonase YvrE